MTDRYIIFDASCFICSSLAAIIEEVAAGKFKTLPLDSEQAENLLRQAFPQGWQHQPYLATVKQDGLVVSARLRMVLALALLLGPKKAWEVYKLARATGIPLPYLPFGHRRAQRRTSTKT
ncbi:MAG TPA: hypothetical protein VKR83_02865 [Ktedonobacteraceae bacterium]|nr:hypothetical protein [Ktedonobacteraceae bacterium]